MKMMSEAAVYIYIKEKAVRTFNEPKNEKEPYLLAFNFAKSALLFVFFLWKVNSIPNPPGHSSIAHHSNNHRKI
jgi:hypothetical protein